MEFEKSGESMARGAAEQAAQGAGTACGTIKNSLDGAQQYIKDKVLNLDLRDFVRREPWLALAGAFAVGYVAAKIMRRVS